MKKLLLCLGVIALLLVAGELRAQKRPHKAGEPKPIRFYKEKVHATVLRYEDDERRLMSHKCAEVHTHQWVHFGLQGQGEVKKRYQRKEDGPMSVLELLAGECARIPGDENRDYWTGVEVHFDAEREVARVVSVLCSGPKAIVSADVERSFSALALPEESTAQGRRELAMGRACHAAARSLHTQMDALEGVAAAKPAE